MPDKERCANVHRHGHGETILTRGARIPMEAHNKRRAAPRFRAINRINKKC